MIAVCEHVWDCLCGYSIASLATAAYAWLLSVLSSMATTGQLSLHAAHTMQRAGLRTHEDGLRDVCWEERIVSMAVGGHITSQSWHAIHRWVDMVRRRICLPLHVLLSCIEDPTMRVASNATATVGSSIQLCTCRGKHILLRTMSTYDV
jgi:hypothetical protein